MGALWCCRRCRCRRPSARRGVGAEPDDVGRYAHGAGDTVRQELLGLYTPLSREHASHVQVRRQASIGQQIQQSAALARDVDWRATCTAHAAAGFHALVVWGPQGLPWLLDNVRVWHNLQDVCSAVQRALHCAVSDDIRVGDYAVGVVQASGAIVITWALLEDALHWRALHRGKNNAAWCIPEQLLDAGAALPSQLQGCVPPPSLIPSKMEEALSSCTTAADDTIRTAAVDAGSPPLHLAASTTRTT